MEYGCVTLEMESNLTVADAIVVVKQIWLINFFLKLLQHSKSKLNQHQALY